MIVLGTFFIQSNQLTVEPVLAGVIVGILSSLVLFIASFPDYDADKSKGRKTLVIAVGKKKATVVFWAFPTIAYSVILFGVGMELFPFFSLITLLSAPLMIRAGLGLKKNYDFTDNLIPSMLSTLMFSRVTGALFVASFLIGSVL
jgi:1,4-dihydroxy-2-naphthoate octaprenyltransferase